MARLFLFLVFTLGVGFGFARPAGAMSGDDMLRFLVQAVCAESPKLTPLDRGCAARRPMTENDPVHWRKHDWGGPAGPAGGWQISDAVLATRAGTPIVTQTFDFGDASGAPHKWGVFDRDIDGADLLRVGDEAAGAFHTRDGSPADIDGRWFVAPDCTSPGWLFFKADVTDSERSAVAPIGAQPGGDAVAGCPAGFAPAYTVYRRSTISVPFLIGGAERPFRVDTIVSGHYNGPTPDTAQSPFERFFFGRDWGKYRWERWEPPSAENAAAAQKLGEARRCPAVPAVGGPPNPGWVMVDCRHWTNLSTENGAWHVRDFGWPPASLKP